MKSWDFVFRIQLGVARFILHFAILAMAPVPACAQETFGGFFDSGSGEANTTSSGSDGGQARGSGGCQGITRFSKIQIEQWTQELVPSGQASCYMKLFQMESGVNPACVARPPHMPNPPGLGLCMIEGQPNQRQARPQPCQHSDMELDGNTEEGVKNQIACCRALMLQTGGTYFSTVRYCN